MNDDRSLPPDDALERALARRAPRGPDATLLADVMSGVRATAQAGRWRVAPGSTMHGARRRTVWLAVAAATLTAILVATLIGSSGSRPTVPGLTEVSTPSPSSASTQTPTPSAEVCATDTIQAIAIPVGTRPDPAPRYTGLGTGWVGYLKAVRSGPSLAGFDVFVATTEGPQASAVARLVGSGLNTATILPAPAGSPALLVRIGHATGGGTAPWCTDLYRVALDGSSVVRLTHDGVDSDVHAAALGRTGSTAIITSRPPGHAADEALSIVAADGSPAMAASDACPHPRPVVPAWSRDGQFVAVVCSGEILVLDPAQNAIHAFVDMPLGVPAGMHWTAAGTIQLETFSSSTMGGLSVSVADPDTGMHSAASAPDDAKIEWVEPNLPEAFSPDTGMSRSRRRTRRSGSWTSRRMSFAWWPPPTRTPGSSARPGRSTGRRSSTSTAAIRQG